MFDFDAPTNPEDGRGCDELPPGGSPPIDPEDPIQCYLGRKDDICEYPATCQDSASPNSYCQPDSYMGTNFGCCKCK